MIQLLDHGYVKFVESWGSDESIIEAARMSTAKGFQGWGQPHLSTCPASTRESYAACVCADSEIGYRPGDGRLLSFLWKNKHLTPFEMAGMVVEVQAPIFVFREWHRHRTQSYNELSARYTELPDLYYIPSVERLMNGKQATKNKQSSEEGFTIEQATTIQAAIAEATAAARREYEGLCEVGVARELSRLVVPVNQYSRMRAQANLRNWLAFLELRMAPGAQWEIRQYANAVATLVAEHFPRTWELFYDDRPDIRT